MNFRIRFWLNSIPRFGFILSVILLANTGFAQTSAKEVEGPIITENIELSPNVKKPQDKAPKKPVTTSTNIKKDNKTNKVRVEAKNGLMIVKEDCPECYPRGVIGMRDTPIENQDRSVRTGSAAQYLLAGKAVEDAQIDKMALAQELNDFVRLSGEYFKSKPDYKGSFVAVFAYYPGNGNGMPYQADIPVKAKNKAQLEALNIAIKNESQCNAEKICSLFAVVAANYNNPTNPLQKVDKNDFGQFMAQQSATKNIQVFHKNKNYKEPVMIILYQGVNGFLISRDYVKESMARMSQDLKELKSTQSFLD